MVMVIAESACIFPVQIHRIGQTRPVRVVRFIMEDSIEERMIKPQDAKSALGKGSVQKLSKEEREKVRM